MKVVSHARRRRSAFRAYVVLGHANLARNFDDLNLDVDAEEGFG